MAIRSGKRIGGVLAAVALVAVLSGCSSSNNKGTANTRSNAAATPAARPAAVSRSFSKAPAFTIDTNRGYLATIKTDKGEIVVELNAKEAPFTVNNFVFLARQHFYDGLTCHRVIPGFVAQCGDPEGNGNGGPGYTIPDEPGKLLHDTGAIAMAKTSAPNSAGSQFYITLAPQPALDGKYTVFGHVKSGIEFVNGLTPRDPAANPNLPPGDRIVGITIAETDTTPTPVAPAAGFPAVTGTPRPAP